LFTSVKNPKILRAHWIEAPIQTKKKRKCSSILSLFILSRSSFNALTPCFLYVIIILFDSKWQDSTSSIFDIGTCAGHLTRTLERAIRQKIATALTSSPVKGPASVGPTPGPDPCWSLSAHSIPDS